jgi:hypothetical protein
LVKIVKWALNLLLLIVGYNNNLNREGHMENKFSTEEAEEVGKKIGITWEKFDIDQFRRGMNVELEHGLRDAETNVSNNDPLTTGKIAWAHLKEFPDYYDRLEKMEDEAEKYWNK